MALIQCPNCGKSVSDKAKACPGCGYQLIADDAAEAGTIVCEECGSTIPEGCDTCPNCGCPVQPHEGQSVLKDKNEPQKVETVNVPLPSAKKSTKKYIGIAAVVLAIVAIVAVAISSVSSKRAQEQYLQNLKTAADTMLEGAADAEKAGTLIHSVWYNTIYEKRDVSTDKYTRKSNGGGAFYDDFNDALSNLFSDSSFRSRVQNIKANRDKVAELMKRLKNPPAEYKEAYDALRELYDAYYELTDCAVNPTGSLTTFTAAFNEADTSTAKYYKAMQIYFD